MLSVAFQLLIYSLCTTSFVASERFLPAAIPSNGSETLTPPKEIQELELIRIMVRQSAGGVLRLELNGTAVSSIGDLRDRLHRLLELAQLPAILEVGPEVEIGNVVAVYDMCLRVGVNGIQLADLSLRID